MSEKQYLRNGNPFITLILCLLGLAATPLVHAETSYLQELEAEAAATDEAGNGASSDEKPSWEQQKATSNAETIEAGKTKTQFEESLKTNFYGSYLFYSTLPDNKQDVVYKEYQSNNDIEHLREVIKSQMSN